VTLADHRVRKSSAENDLELCDKAASMNFCRTHLRPKWLFCLVLYTTDLHTLISSSCFHYRFATVADLPSGTFCVGRFQAAVSLLAVCVLYDGDGHSSVPHLWLQAPLEWCACRVSTGHFGGCSSGMSNNSWFVKITGWFLFFFHRSTVLVCDIHFFNWQMNDPHGHASASTLWAAIGTFCSRSHSGLDALLRTTYLLYMFQ
jgi:hypothetical protein